MHEAPVVKNHDDPHSDSTVWVGLIGGLLLLLLIFGLQLVFHRWQGAETQSKRGRAGDERLTAMRAEQAGLLEGYAVIDAEQGVLRMPIEAAMARVATGQAQSEVQP